MRIILLVISGIFGIVDFWGFGIGQYLVIESYSEKTFKKLRIISLSINICFLTCMIILSIMYEEKANIIVLILFLSQLFILGLYQIIINICAWLIRQKLIERSIHETLNSNPMISDFNTVINKCVIEFKSIKEKEAKRVLRQLLNSNTKIAEKIRK